jgi:hypothetical protein
MRMLFLMMALRAPLPAFFMILASRIHKAVLECKRGLDGG